MSGMVNGEVCNVLLDNGTDIAVIPHYLVEPNQLLQEFYLVRGIHGHLIYRQKAKVDLTVGGTTVTRVAAVAHRKTHGEHVVLDVNLANSVDRSIVDACFPSPSMQVNAVETEPRHDKEKWKNSAVS